MAAATTDRLARIEARMRMMKLLLGLDRAVKIAILAGLV